MKIADIILRDMAALSEHMKTLKDADLVSAQAEFGEMKAEYLALNREVPAAPVQSEAQLDLVREAASYLSGRKVSDRAMDALQPKTQFGKSILMNYPGAIAFPVSLFRSLTTAATAEALKTSQAQPVGSTIVLPVPATPITDMVSKISTRDGITIPRALQTGLAPMTSTISGGTTYTPGTDKTDAGYVTIEDLVIKPLEYNSYATIPNITSLRSPGYLDLVQRLVVAKVRSMIETDIVTGTYADTDKGIEGILTASGTLTAGLAATGAFAYSDAVYMKWKGRPEWYTEAQFLFAASTAAALEQELDGNKRPLFVDKTSQAMYATIDGRNYVLSSDMPAVGDAGAIVYWTPANYVLAYDEDVMIVRDNSGLTLRKANSTGLFVWANVGGKLVQPLTLVKSLSTTR